MTPLRTARLPECVWRINRARRKDPLPSYRQFSWASTTRISSRSPGTENPHHIYHSLSRPWTNTPKALALISTTRFASTNSNSPSALDATPIFSPEVNVPSIDQHVSRTFEDIISSDLPAVTEHIGFLKELGINYGWGPTAFVQTLLEHVHVYSGLPWWSSIILTAVLVRVSLIKLFIGASDTSARLAVLQPVVQPIKDRMKAAQHAKDIQAVKMHAAEMSTIYKNANVKVYKMFLPLIQIPIGFGTFRLLRGMSALPVPGLQDGGVLWMKDLTVGDPFFILPVVTGLAFHYTIKGGGETGSNPMMNPGMQTAMRYGIPIFTSACMLGMPGSLQLTFACSSGLSLLQMYLLRQPWCRAFLNIQPLPIPTTITPNSTPSTPSYIGTLTRHEPPSPTPALPLPAPKSVLGDAVSTIKGAASKAMDKAKKFRASAAGGGKSATRRRSEAELRKATAYEQRRQRELVQERLDSRYAKRERRRERREAQ